MATRIFRDKETWKRKISEAVKKLWKTPEFREKVLRSIRNLEIRKKISEGLKRKYLLDPTQRIKISEAIKEAWKKPEIRKKWCEVRKGLLKGEKHPNWKGGKTFLVYPEEFYRIRKEVINRDNHTCQLCGRKTKLHVHHIDSDTKNNKPQNLITLCNRCHGRVHGNETFWREILKNLVKKNYLPCNLN
jgi:hypothetical protein